MHTPLNPATETACVWARLWSWGWMRGGGKILSEWTCLSLYGFLVWKTHRFVTHFLPKALLHLPCPLGLLSTLLTSSWRAPPPTPSPHRPNLLMHPWGMMGRPGVKGKRWGFLAWLCSVNLGNLPGPVYLTVSWEGWIIWSSSPFRLCNSPDGPSSDQTPSFYPIWIIQDRDWMALESMCLLPPGFQKSVSGSLSKRPAGGGTWTLHERHCLRSGPSALSEVLPDP